MPSLAEASLTETEARMLAHFVGRLREELDVEAVWLYGSRARGEAVHSESDVDVLVLARDRRRDRQRVWELMYEAAGAEGANPGFFSPQVWDLEWLANRRAIDSFFLREVERDRIVLYERP